MNTKTIVFMILCLLMVGCVSMKEKNPKESFRYDISCAGAGTQGTYLVKVYVYSKDKDVSDDELKQAAVHGVIFRGFSGTTGCTSQKPLARSSVVEQEKSDYFNAFFASGGVYLRFASVISASYERIKTANNDYKVGAVLRVQKDDLRKELEGAGIIRGLSSGF
jgi:hypothetical protein